MPAGEIAERETEVNTVMDKLRALLIPTPTGSTTSKLSSATPLALNLRNDISHGLVPIVRPVDAALLMHAACWLATLRLRPPSES